MQTPFSQIWTASLSNGNGDRLNKARKTLVTGMVIAKLRYLACYLAPTNFTSFLGLTIDFIIVKLEYLSYY